MQLPCFEWENNARENTLSWYNPATLLIGNTEYLAVIPPKFEPSLQFQSKSYSDYTLGFFRRGMIAPAKHLI